MTIEPHKELLIAARQALDDLRTDAHCVAADRASSRLLGLLAYRYRAPEIRCIGTRKARLQAAGTAAPVNLDRISRRLAAQPA